VAKRLNGPDAWFEMVNGVGRGMGVLDAGGDRRMGRGSFGENLGHPTVTNRDFAMQIFPNYGTLDSLSLQSSAVEQVLDILMDILSWEIADVVSPCLPRSL